MVDQFWREDGHFDGVSPRKGSGSLRMRSGRLLSDRQLAGLYLHSRFARLIVDRPAQDATRRGWKIEVDDNTSGVDPFAEHFDRLGIRQKFNEAMKQAGIFGGAGIVMILDDDGELWEPVRGRVRGVKALHVFSRCELEPASWHEDIEAGNFGEPETYWLSPKSRHSAETPPRVHADRLIRFPGLSVPDDAVHDYDGWDQSKIEAAFTELVDINTATDSVREAIDQFQYGVLKLKNLKQVLTGPDGDADNAGFRRRLDALEEGKATTRMIVIDGDDEYGVETMNFSGLVEAYRTMQQNLSAVSRIPLTLLFGQSPAGLSTDDQSGTRNYYDGIAADQEEVLEPGLLRLANLLSQAHDDLPDDGYRVKFHALLTPSEKEEAEIRNIVADADAKNIDRGIYTADEARGRYTAAGFSADLVVSSDDPDDEADYLTMMEHVRELRESDDLPDIGASDPPMEAPPQPEADAPDREFNDAQIASMADVVAQVARGELPEGGAIEILILGFGITREHARRFFADKRIKEDPEEITTNDDDSQDQ